jgi:SNF2 family DNA or RNA helicase
LDTIAVIVAAVIFIGVTGYLVAAMIRHIQTEKRSSRLQKVFDNFGLSIVLATLFFVTWIGQAVVEWPVFANEQRQHGETPTAGDYFIEFSQSTLENWQSEFLQLFSFVVLAAVLVHHGSAESKDSDDRVEAALARIEKRLEDKE